MNWASVAHSCNPSYSRGRDQEDCALKPAQVYNSGRTYLEKPFTKIGLVEWLKVKAMSLSPSSTKKQMSNSLPPKKKSLIRVSSRAQRQCCIIS
jgi:hypothetical protein